MVFTLHFIAIIDILSSSIGVPKTEFQNSHTTLYLLLTPHYYTILKFLRVIFDLNAFNDNLIWLTLLKAILDLQNVFYLNIASMISFSSVVFIMFWLNNVFVIDFLPVTTELVKTTMKT